MYLFLVRVCIVTILDGTRLMYSIYRREARSPRIDSYLVVVHTSASWMLLLSVIRSTYTELSMPRHPSQHLVFVHYGVRQNEVNFVMMLSIEPLIGQIFNLYTPECV